MNYQQFQLSTPGLLFSAISLLMLAYTNRFLSYGALVRGLHEKYHKTKDGIYLRQIQNLRKRLTLIRILQQLGISSLLLCVISMLLTFLGIKSIAAIIFGIALILLASSLTILMIEIQLSTKALDMQIKDMDNN